MTEPFQIPNPEAERKLVNWSADVDLENWRPKSPPLLVRLILYPVASWIWLRERLTRSSRMRSALSEIRAECVASVHDGTATTHTAMIHGLAVAALDFDVSDEVDAFVPGKGPYF